MDAPQAAARVLGAGIPGDAMALTVMGFILLVAALVALHLIARSRRKILRRIEDLQEEREDLRQSAAQACSDRQEHAERVSRLEGAISSLDEGVGMLDAAGRLTLVNSGLAKLLGAESKDLLGEEFTSFFPDAPPLEPDGQSRETVLTARDGTSCPVRIKGTPLAEKGWCWVVNDLAEPKEAEEGLKASQDRFRHVFQSMSEAVVLFEIVHDPEGTPVDYRIVDVNPAFAKHTGQPVEGVLGKRTADFYIDHAPPHLDLFSRVAYTGRPAFFETYYEPLGFHFAVSVFSWERGKFGAIFSNITEKKWAAAEMKKLEERVRRSQRMEAVGSLAGGIAHDFNNILGNILGYTELIRSEIQADSEANDFLEMIISVIRRASNLTNKLLAFARRRKLRSVRVNAHEALDETIALLERTMDRRIVIRRDYEADPPSFSGDPAQVQNALLNLAVNAQDAMPRGGELLFATKTMMLDEDFCEEQPFELLPGYYVQITITDTGIGMDADTMKHIFEPFFTTKGVGDGTGLGLSAVFGILTGHRGAVIVNSEPGSGSSFSLYFPAQEKEDMPRSDSGESLSLEGVRVLVADDEEGIRYVMTRMLEKRDMIVSTCHDGTSAADYFDEHAQDVDLVLLDLVMPGLYGPEVFMRMKAAKPAMRAIIMTGFSLERDTEELLNAGALGFLSKPFSEKELLTEVRRVLAAPTPSGNAEESSK
jgi:PAS domain S-box-containing protein